jgi:hypothetical protein
MVRRQFIERLKADLSASAWHLLRSFCLALPMKLEQSTPSSVTPDISELSIKSRDGPSFFLVGAIAAVLVLANVAASAAQQLPTGGGPIPPVRRAPDGKIEVVTPSAKPPAAVTTPNAGARQATARPGPAPTDASENAAARPDAPGPGTASSDASESTRPATQRAPVNNIPVSGDQSPPSATVVSQIHNAPGWQHSHAYTYATGPYTRVVNGPGQNEANGTYNPGQTLEAYQLTSTGSCESAASSGPTGTGSAIQDGTCTWKYLSPVDYNSITGWAFDNKPWQSGATYNYRDYVVSDSPLRAYTLENDNCVSTNAPTGAGQDLIVKTGDGCQWHYFAPVLYTSGKSYIPTQTFRNGKGLAAYNLRVNYAAHLWNDREYLAGANGELLPIRTQAHFDYQNDEGNGYNSEGIGISCTTCYHMVITAAPGESFRDKLTPDLPLTGYDPTKGVAIRNSSNRYPALLLRDNFVDFIGLQVKSDHTSAFDAASGHGNEITIRASILEGGAAGPTVMLDSGPSVLSNSLVISHANIGVKAKYPAVILHSTIVNPDHTANSIGIESDQQWYLKYSGFQIRLFSVSRTQRDIRQSANMQTTVALSGQRTRCTMPRTPARRIPARLLQGGTPPWRPTLCLAQSTASRWQPSSIPRATTGSRPVPR